MTSDTCSFPVGCTENTEDEFKHWPPILSSALRSSGAGLYYRHREYSMLNFLPAGALNESYQSLPKSRAFKGSGESIYFLHKEPEGTLESAGVGGERRVSETSSGAVPVCGGPAPSILTDIHEHQMSHMGSTEYSAFGSHEAVSLCSHLLLWKEAESALPSWYSNEILGRAAQASGCWGCSSGEGVSCWQGEAR